MAIRNEGKDTTGAAIAGVHSHRPSPDLLVGALEADANAEGFAAGERTTELEDGMGDLGGKEETAAGPDPDLRETEHHGAAAVLITPTHQGTAGIPEEVERLEKEKFGDQDKPSHQP
jgi:hypothetical protein